MVIVEPNSGKYLLICNTHLQSKHAPSYIKQRAKQLKIVNDAITEFKNHLASRKIIINEIIITTTNFNILFITFPKGIAC